VSAADRSASGPLAVPRRLGGNATIAAMLNYIWFGLMAIALIVAIFTGNAAALTKASVDSAKTAVEISLGLVGIMTLWLGIMRVAEQAGLVAMLSRILRPISRILFPEVPPEHPAIGAMVMSLSANMLGLNNAATPLGIKAMEELQTLNPDKETASNPMVTFMVLNTAGVQFIPTTIIGVLAASGALAPTSIIPTTLIATLCGAVAAVTTAKLLQRFFPTRTPTADGRQPIAIPERPIDGNEVGP
jgi:spore maturation protein A